jgi:DNA-binding GntR family transcriptional regulator
MTIAAGEARPQPDTPLPGRLGRTAAAPLWRELVKRSEESGGETAVTVAELADTLGLSDRTIQRATVALLAEGLLRVEETRGGRNRYLPQPLSLLTIAFD